MSTCCTSGALGRWSAGGLSHDREAVGLRDVVLRGVRRGDPWGTGGAAARSRPRLRGGDRRLSELRGAVASVVTVRVVRSDVRLSRSLGLMTPRRRARVPKARDCPRGPPEPAATPCRHSAMTADEPTPGNGQERTGIDCEKVSEVARQAAADSLLERASDVQSVAHRVGSELRDGEGPTAEQVQRVRREIDGLRFAVEEYMAALSDGAEPWEKDGYHRTAEELEALLESLCVPESDGGSDDC